MDMATDENDEFSASDVAALGGEARAQKLSPDKRREIARAAARERWIKAGKAPLPQALRSGPLRIGGIELDCAVLDDPQNTRVISETKFMSAMGMYRSGAVSTRRVRDEAGAQIPLFLAHKNLRPFVDKHLSDVHLGLLQYRTLGGGVSHAGIPADLLPKVCEVWIDADRVGVLGPRQKVIAAKADILLRGFAHVGIIALIDEATGFQDDRASDALAKILEAFVARELRKWVKTFPPEFYKELFRLRGIPFTGQVKRPSYIGHLTNDLVYARLAPGVLAELRVRNPVAKTGHRRHKHFQWLTPDIGHPKLQQHLSSVTTLMRASEAWDGFKKLIDRALPKYQEMPLFDDLKD
jgi:hypothetical protein